MHKENITQRNIQGMIQTTGGFNIQNNLLTVIFTEIPQEMLKAIFKLIRSSNVQLTQ